MLIFFTETLGQSPSISMSTHHNLAESPTAANNTDTGAAIKTTSITTTATTPSENNAPDVTFTTASRYTQHVMFNIIHLTPTYTLIVNLFLLSNLKVTFLLSIILKLLLSFNSKLALPAESLPRKVKTHWGYRPLCESTLILRILLPQDLWARGHLDQKDMK